MKTSAIPPSLLASSFRSNAQFHEALHRLFLHPRFSSDPMCKRLSEEFLKNANLCAQIATELERHCSAPENTPNPEDKS